MASVLWKNTLYWSLSVGTKDGKASFELCSVLEDRFEVALTYDGRKSQMRMVNACVPTLTKPFKWIVTRQPW